MLVISLERIGDQGLGVSGLRARTTLLVRTQTGRFDDVTFLVDPGSSVTTISVTQAADLGIVVPGRAVDVTVHTALGKMKQRRRPGFIHVHVPGFSGRPFVWPCHFVEQRGNPPAALGLAGVLDDLV